MFQYSVLCQCFRDQKDMNCCAGKLFNRIAQLGVAYSCLPSLLLVDVFVPLTCLMCSTTCSALGCKVTCLLCHCS